MDAAKRVLVVEDDPLQQAVLKSLLQQHGHEVEVSGDGMDALWKAREGQFDLVLLDYQMPEIDGLTAARLVADFMGDAARPRLVALTAAPDQLLRREQMTDRAFDGVISKQVSLPELIQALNYHLTRAQDRRAVRDAEQDLLVQEWRQYDVGPDRPPADNGAARILVVEDDAAQQSVLASALDAQGYQVEVAADGLAAVRKLRASRFDLALVDFELPEIDGATAARLIASIFSDAVRPRLIGLTAAPHRVQDRLAGAERIFDVLLGKLEGLPAVLAAVRDQLRRTAATMPGSERAGANA